MTSQSFSRNGTAVLDLLSEKQLAKREEEEELYYCRIILYSKCVSLNCRILPPVMLLLATTPVLVIASCYHTHEHILT